MGMRGPVCYSQETNLFNIVAGAGNITTTPTGRDMPRVRRSGARLRLRFFVDNANITIGDGTYSHCIAIVARPDGLGATPWEMVGFAGILMGGVAPQLPLVVGRNFSQILVGMDGYSQIGICGFAANESPGAANNFAVFGSWILDDGAGVP